MSIIRKTRFTAALMWAMIPLSVFASLPRIGCICANGDHKFFCERHANRDGEGRCTCCHGRPKGRNLAGADREQVTKPCDRCIPKSCHPSDSGMRSERPCRPVVDKTEYVKAAKVITNLHRADSKPLFVAFESRPLVVAAFTAAAHYYGERLPPPDLVVTLGVLLI